MLLAVDTEDFGSFEGAKEFRLTTLASKDLVCFSTPIEDRFLALIRLGRLPYRLTCIWPNFIRRARIEIPPLRPRSADCRMPSSTREL